MVSKRIKGLESRVAVIWHSTTERQGVEALLYLLLSHCAETASAEPARASEGVGDQVVETIVTPCSSHAATTHVASTTHVSPTPHTRPPSHVPSSASVVEPAP